MPEAPMIAALAEASAEQTAERAFRRLIRTLGLIERVMQPHFARFGITGSQWGVLRAIHRSAGDGRAGLRLTDLSNRLLIRPPSVTGVVERLVKLGLVAREAAPGDLRAKNVTLTPRGRETVNRVLADHQAQLDRVMAGLNESELRQLEAQLVNLDVHLENLLRPEES